ncbi:MAG: hypothetical protein AB1894_16130 [Chloroflexota bacterium]
MKTPSRKIILTAISILSFIFSVIWVIVQPGFEPLIGILTSLAALLASFRAGDEPITQLSSASITPEQHQRNRQNMLHLMWNTWIEGVLKKSLHNEVLIELGMEAKPDAVEHPWDMVMQMPDREPKMVKPGTTILELFDQSNGSLLILGEPGAGKTTMLLELTRLAILRAQNDSSRPIPVVFNLSSWRPGQRAGGKEHNPGEDFAEWLVEELKSKYYVTTKIGYPWVEEDALLLLLDGLDEVAADIRDACVTAINAFRVEHSMPMAVCSRAQEYDELTAQIKLRGAALIKPLTDQQVSEYLQAAGSGLVAIHQTLQHDLELRVFAQTPLILSVLVLAYRNATEEELKALAVTNNYRERLFNTYIAQMFKRRGEASQFNPEKIQRWLTNLAREMKKRGQYLFNLEDIRLNWLPISEKKRRKIFNIVFGLIMGLSVGLMAVLSVGLSFGPGIGLTTGILIGLFVGLSGVLLISLPRGHLIELIDIKTIGWHIADHTDAPPVDKVSWSWKDAWGRLATVAGIGLIVGLFLGLLASFFTETPFLLWFGSVSLLTIILMGFSSIRRSVSVDIRNNPGEGISQTLRYSLGSFFAYGLPSGLLLGFTYGMAVSIKVGISGGLIIGLLFGIVGGFYYGGNYLVSHYVSRYLLYRLGYIPWNLIRFLDYCTDRIFLRRVGGGYIFVHRMLMEHFAEMDEERIRVLVERASP